MRIMGIRCVVVASALWLLAGCGALEEFPIDEQPSGRVCYDDSDCVAATCCGGSGVVHLDDAPACAAVQCNNGCEPGSVDCGCSIPVCRESRCVAARTFNDQCP